MEVCSTLRYDNGITTLNKMNYLSPFQFYMFMIFQSCPSSFGFLVSIYTNYQLQLGFFEPWVILSVANLLKNTVGSYEGESLPKVKQMNQYGLSFCRTYVLSVCDLRLSHPRTICCQILENNERLSFQHSSFFFYFS